MDRNLLVLVLLLETAAVQGVGKADATDGRQYANCLACIEHGRALATLELAKVTNTNLGGHVIVLPELYEILLVLKSSLFRIIFYLATV
jgi:hypothetical protein